MSSSVLLAVGYSNFREWPIACSRALLLGLTLTVLGNLFLKRVLRLYSKYSSFSVLQSQLGSPTFNEGGCEKHEVACVLNSLMTQYCGSELWVAERPAVLRLVCRTIATNLTALT